MAGLNCLTVCKSFFHSSAVFVDPGLGVLTPFHVCHEKKGIGFLSLSCLELEHFIYPSNIYILLRMHFLGVKDRCRSGVEGKGIVVAATE